MVPPRASNDVYDTSDVRAFSRIRRLGPRPAELAEGAELLGSVVGLAGQPNLQAREGRSKHSPSLAMVVLDLVSKVAPVIRIY